MFYEITPRSHYFSLVSNYITLKPYLFFPTSSRLQPSPTRIPVTPSTHTAPAATSTFALTHSQVHFDCLYRGITAISSRESKLLAGNRAIAQPCEFKVKAQPGKERKGKEVQTCRQPKWFILCTSNTKTSIGNVHYS